MIADLARAAKHAAETTNQRRVLVCAGDRDRGIDAAYTAIDAVDVDDTAVSFVSTRDGFRFDAYGPRSADGLLGRTREVLVLDCHEQCVPNALGQCVGAVDGGGLLILLTPDLNRWPTVRDRFDDSLAAPPYDIDDVTGRFRTRLVDTLRTHPGIAIVSLGETPSASALERNALACDSSPTMDGRRSHQRIPDPDRGFPAEVYAACHTSDQARAVRAFETLTTPGNAIVVEADRGRGKSSAAGLAAGSLAAAGDDVLVTAPRYQNAAELFARAREVLSTDNTALDADSQSAIDERTIDERTVHASTGGRVRYLSPADAATESGDPDVVIVDEAAALPVRLLNRLHTAVDARSLAFCTTVHGYEGAGRGFAVRFRERLLDGPFTVTDVRLAEPIRYARNDPVESWAARALLLDASPAVETAVADATVADAEYRTLSPDSLLADEPLLREAFGLLVAAHYRTEPNDLARLLDAPNLSTRALVVDGRVVSVALLAREGGIDAATRRQMYEGKRVRGNMVPDLLTSQLRDEAAAEPQGVRVVRIATHHAVRGRGFGSRLLGDIHAECATGEAAADYMSVGYGATPRLLRFWRRAGYRTVHLATTRNDVSGEHSAIMVRPLTETGHGLLDRHERAFRDRERDGLSDAHRDADPDVVIGALAACSASVSIDLTDAEWRSVVAASVGPGMYDTAPGAFRDLALATLIGEGAIEADGSAKADGNPDHATRTLNRRERRLLVRKVLQGQPWEAVADELGYESTTACMRALGSAYEPLVERYGTTLALRERARFVDE